MRAKVVLSAAVLALVVLAPAFYFHNRPSGSTTAAQPVAASEDAAGGSSATPAILRRITGPGVVPVSGSSQENAAADVKAVNHEDYVAQRKDELYRMGVSQDPASLKAILIDVHNPDPEIRHAALTATMDFDSKDAIPTLRNELTWAEDPQEKADIQEAIQFLELPPFELDANGGLTQQSSDPTSAGN